MVRVEGIVSSASTPTAKATQLHLYCRGCRHVVVIKVKRGYSGAQIPRTCEKFVFGAKSI